MASELRATELNQVPAVPAAPAAGKVSLTNASVFYDRDMALHNVSLEIPERQVTAVIGPSGCGKSTLLRAINRMTDTIRGFRVEGQVRLDGEDIYAPEHEVAKLRRRVGMVFQRSNPAARTVFENVAFGLRNLGITSRMELGDRVQHALMDAALWREVSDRLNSNALALSADGSLLASGDEEGHIAVWSVDQGKQIASLRRRRLPMLHSQRQRRHRQTRRLQLRDRHRREGRPLRRPHREVNRRFARMRRPGPWIELKR